MRGRKSLNSRCISCFGPRCAGLAGSRGSTGGKPGIPVPRERGLPLVSAGRAGTPAGGAFTSLAGAVSSLGLR